MLFLISELIINEICYYYFFFTSSSHTFLPMVKCLQARAFWVVKFWYSWKPVSVHRYTAEPETVERWAIAAIRPMPGIWNTWGMDKKLNLLAIYFILILQTPLSKAVHGMCHIRTCGYLWKKKCVCNSGSHFFLCGPLVQSYFCLWSLVTCLWLVKCKSSVIFLSEAVC